MATPRTARALVTTATAGALALGVAGPAAWAAPAPAAHAAAGAGAAASDGPLDPERRAVVADLNELVRAGHRLTVDAARHQVSDGGVEQVRRRLATALTDADRAHLADHHPAKGARGAAPSALAPTGVPSAAPSVAPSGAPSAAPSVGPAADRATPSAAPSAAPTPQADPVDEAEDALESQIDALTEAASSGRTDLTAPLGDLMKAIDKLVASLGVKAPSATLPDQPGTSPSAQPGHEAQKPPSTLPASPDAAEPRAPERTRQTFRGWLDSLLRPLDVFDWFD